MNAKEEIIKMLRKEVIFFNNCNSDPSKLLSLIAATEQAIFDVPSEEEIDENFSKLSHTNDYYDGCNFILNYKKPESDGK